MKKALSSNFEEARATVRTKNGKYFDLSKESLVKDGVKKLSDEQMNKLFRRLRLRFTLTPVCNAWCAFCSNEGSSYAAKKQKHSNVELVIKLCDILTKNTPLKSIDFSGGEPTIHPDFISQEFKLINWTKKHPNIRFSLHTNGINLNPKIIDKIKENFSRIGVSVHSLDFSTWNKMTNHFDTFSVSAQKLKFEKMMKNLEYLSKQNIGEKVFIKSVVMRGVNDSKEELKKLMDFCAKNKFHPKLLEFEPQYPEQKKYVVGRKELFKKLEEIGCEFTEDAPRHNNPNTYIPGVNFSYKRDSGARTGLHSIFGCGQKAACMTCYDFLCIFVKPSEDGKGLFLKPCAALDTRIDLTQALNNENFQHIFNLFRLSREYLMLAPGLGVEGWNKEEELSKEVK